MKINKIRKLKNVALERLSPCWGECVGILIVFLGLVTIFASAFMLVVRSLYRNGSLPYDMPEIITRGTPSFYIAAVICTVVFYTLASPLKYGICWFYFQAVNKKNAPASCFFSCYAHRTHFFRTICLNTAALAIKTAAALPLIIVSAAGFFIVNQLLNGKSIPVYIIAAVILVPLLIGAVLFFLNCSLNYMLVPFIYIDNPDAGIRQIIRESRRCSAGHRRYILQTLLSFSGWLIAGVLIFPYIYSLPYYCMTVAALSKELISLNKKRTGKYSTQNEEEETVLAR